MWARYCADQAHLFQMLMQSSKPPCKVDTIVVPISQMRKQRHKKAK